MLSQLICLWSNAAVPVLVPQIVAIVPLNQESGKFLLSFTETPLCFSKLKSGSFIRIPLLVKRSSNGLGLFSTTSLSKGQFISTYSGQLISVEEGRGIQTARVKAGLGNYILTLRETYGSQVIETTIDPTEIGNVGRFASELPDHSAYQSILFNSTPPRRMQITPVLL